MVLPFLTLKFDIRRPNSKPSAVGIKLRLGLLRQAVQGRFCSYPALDSDPLFSTLRHTTEFQEIRSAAMDCQKKFLAYRSQMPH